MMHDIFYNGKNKYSILTSGYIGQITITEALLDSYNKIAVTKSNKLKMFMLKGHFMLKLHLN